jgi:SAM-dependent methyltransferase
MLAAPVSLKQKLVSQFHRPRGLAGQVVGWVMATRGSNRARTRWVVSLLDVQPAERVLEIGFGPGLGICELARRAAQVHGVDHSAVMVRQATRRNAAAVREGRVALVRASVDALPSFGAPLDAIVAVNTVGMWPSPADRLAELRELLRPGGRIALASQPRCPGATAETTTRAGQELATLLRAAGFGEPRTEVLELDPPVACVLATRPPAG